MGKSVRRASFHEKDDLVFSAVVGEVDVSAVVGTAVVESAAGGTVACTGASAMLGSEASEEGVFPSEFPSAGSAAAPPRKRVPDRVDMLFLCIANGVFLRRNVVAVELFEVAPIGDSAAPTKL